MAAGGVVLAGMFAGPWAWKRRSVSVSATVGVYVGAVVAAIVG